MPHLCTLLEAVVDPNRRRRPSVEKAGPRRHLVHTPSKECRHGARVLNGKGRHRSSMIPWCEATSPSVGKPEYGGRTTGRI
jgi:hypothetical protein